MPELVANELSKDGGVFGGLPPEPPKTPEPPPEVTKVEEKVEEKPEEKVVEAPETTEKLVEDDIDGSLVPDLSSFKTGKFPTGKKEVTPRKFDGVEDSDIPLFRQMSNAAYEKMYPLYLSHKESEKKLAEKDAELTKVRSTSVSDLPPSYYSHPNAYVLNPKYQKAAYDASMADKIVDHWTEQLVNIRNGKPWVDLDIGKEGNFIYSQPQQSNENGSSEVAVMRNLQFATNQQFKLTSEVSKFVNEHQTRHSRDVDFIRQAINTYFPGYDKSDHPTANMQKELIKALPESMQDSPVATLFACSAAANLLQAEEIKKLKVESEKNKSIKADASAAPPAISQLKAGAGSRNGPIISLEAFKMRE